MGAIANFSDEAALRAAAQSIRGRGYYRVAAHFPATIDATDESPATRRSGISRSIRAVAILGVVLGSGFLWNRAALGAKIVDAGASITFPVTEVTTALALIAGVFWLFGLGLLPGLSGMRSEEFDRTAAEQFLLAIDARDPEFDARATPSLLRAVGGRNVVVVTG